MYHADHVGSLIRPRSLIEARTAFLNGQLGKEALREEEDKVIGDLIAMQEEVGLNLITDGEARRNNWRDRFFESVDGFSRERVPSSFVFTSDEGVKSPGMPIPTVTAKLKRRESLTTDDFKFLKQRTTRTAKATLPSPSANHFFSGDAGFAKSPYRTRAEFFADVCSIYRQEIADLEAAGCTFVQIDEVPIAVLCDPANVERVRARGEDPGPLTTVLANDTRGRPCTSICAKEMQAKVKARADTIASRSGSSSSRTLMASCSNMTRSGRAASPLCGIFPQIKARCLAS